MRGSIGWTVAAVLVAAVGCKAPDPKDPQTWIRQLTDPDARVRSQAVEQLRKLHARQAALQVAALLKDPSVKEEAALALGTIGGPESVQPLLDAIDPVVGTGSDAATRIANRTNARIADALGAIGYANAGPALLRLARGHDDLVRISAVQALGEVKDRAAVPELSRLIDDETTPPILTKKAAIALGKIGDSAAQPALLHALVLERHGVSFLPEASFALCQLGASAVDPLIAVASDQDPVYLAWAKENGRSTAGTDAKAALVLGDLGDPKAIPVLLTLLRYTDSDPIPQTSRLLSTVVRQFAADALGRLRAEEAAAPILALVSTKAAGDEDSATFYGNALVWIGERAQAKELLRRAQSGAVLPRLALVEAAALFGDPALQKEVAQLAAKEAKGKPKECAAELTEITSAPADEKGACEAVAAKFAALAAPLVAAEECGKTAEASACWTGKLASPDPLVRSRAAYELGRAGVHAAVPALVKQASDDSTAARLAAIRALEWLLPDAAAQPQLKAAAPLLAAQLAAEQGRIQFIKVDEDLRRLQLKLSRL